MNKQMEYTTKLSIHYRQNSFGTNYINGLEQIIQPVLKLCVAKPISKLMLKRVADFDL
jgi:hypothetical protein